MTRLNKAELAAIQEAISTTPKSRTRIVSIILDVDDKLAGMFDYQLLW